MVKSKTLLNLAYVHIGKTLPECFLDNIYQMLLLNYSQIKVYILLDDDLIEDVKKNVLLLNDIYFNGETPLSLQFEFIRNSLIEEKYLGSGVLGSAVYYKYTEAIKKYNLEQFRDGFWVTTTKRFFYLLGLMDMFYLENVFHIENDVILYDSLTHIYESLYVSNDKLIFVRDSANRVIPSIVFIPNKVCIERLVNHISNTLDASSSFLNDMVLLATYPDYYEFNIFPSQNNKYIFDGAAIGQYIDGTDIRNLPNLPSVESDSYEMLKNENPSVGFINETCIYKPNVTKFYKKLCNVDNISIPLNIMLADTSEINCTNIVGNVHVHSKQLYKFSSVFDMSFSDIITGDRVVGLCDFVISVRQINEFHKNIENFISPDKILLIKDFNNINYKGLSNIFKSVNKKCLKLFIYTHLLPFLTSVKFFHNLDKEIDYVIYLHNSDHSLNETVSSFLDENLTHIKKVYSQNPDYNSPKVNLLPIGLANSMWPHGNLLEFYKTMKNTYMLKKSKNIYININPGTFSYRKTIIDILQSNNWTLSASKPYKDYLYELSSHYFCLCVRGNGIDTHRFWESLYLGVIPVIINNEYTNCQNFVDLLNEIAVPFYEIKSHDIFSNKYESEIFNELLYKKILTKTNNSIQNLNCLKLDFYKDN